MVSLTLFSVAILIGQTNAQPAYVYDGSSTVNITGSYNWTLKYELGVLCDDPNWTKTLSLDIIAITVEADLIMAFGTSTKYFAFAFPYDGTLWITLQGANTPDEDKGSAWVAPAPGQSLIDTPSLEAQYSVSQDFRTSLIPDSNVTKWWHRLQPPQQPLSANTSPLELEIIGDRLNGITQLTVTKNNASETVSIGSTWDYGDGQIYLYLGMDSIHGEIFTLTGITSVDQCSWQPAPTPPTAPPTMVPTGNTPNPTLIPTGIPSNNPTYNPSFAPTDNTTNPTIDPSQNPSTIPTEMPSVNPTKGPTTVPSSVPSDNPTKVPSSNPTKGPAVITTEEVVVSSTQTPTDTTQIEDTVDDGQGEGKSESFIEGESAIYVWIGIAIGGAILVGLLSLTAYRLYQKRKMKQAIGSMSYSSNWQAH